MTETENFIFNRSFHLALRSPIVMNILIMIDHSLKHLLQEY